MDKSQKKDQLMRNGSIGAILLDYGKITVADIEKVISYQKETGLFFGDAVVKMELASKEDVEMAIAHQFAHPYLKSNEENSISKDIISAYNPFGPKVEVFRNIRTSLLLSGAGQSLKSICMTACRPGDGKTFIGCNLAVVFAQLGHKTLLMDFNLKDPKIHKLFRLKNSSGVSTMLINRSTLDEAVRNTTFKKLDVLPSGPLPPNPLDLIGHKTAINLMETLKNIYDVIIVNTPSLGTGAYVSYLASFMDGVLMVVLNKKTRKDELEKAKLLIESAGSRIIGAVLNQR